MSWQQWVLVGYMLGQMLRLTYMVGRERKPMTLGYAIAGLMEFAFVIVLVVTS